MQRRTLAEGQGSICSIWRRGSWEDFCPEGKNEPFHVFETPWGVEFGKVRRTGSNVHQRFLLPMCRAQATVATVAAAPFASFSGRTEKGGPARPERMLNFLFLWKQFTTDSIKSIFLNIFAESSLCILMNGYTFFNSLKNTAQCECTGRCFWSNAGIMLFW